MAVTRPGGKPSGTTPLTRGPDTLSSPVGGGAPTRPAAPASTVSTNETRRSTGLPERRPLAEPGAIANAILVLSRWLQNVSIGLWMGGLLTLGALVAPYAVHYFPNRVEAGKFLGPLFPRLTQAGVVCGTVYLLMLLIHDSLWKRYHPATANSLLTVLRFLVVAGMIGACSYLLLRVGPVMEHLQQSATVVNGSLSGDAGTAFDSWHHLYERISKALFPAGMALLLLTHMSRRSGGRA